MLTRKAISLSRTFATEAHSRLKPALYTAVILNRAPILTPSPTPFENAFYAYQQRIQRALHNPFPSEFYFKPGSLLEARFNAEERIRERIAWGPTYVKNDTERTVAEEAAIEQMEMQEQTDDKLMARVHASDLAKDYHSLDRKGRRNLYLLVQRVDMTTGQVVWEFPCGEVGKEELLHQAAQRELVENCGAHMDTWVVARKPIGVHKSFSTPQQEKVTFFFKANIMAGQARIGNKSIQDFAWVTKQEIEKRATEEYWTSVSDMLSDH
ncbi:50S ribosomal subunit L30 [Mycena indigotica]|uniref:Large ribosomal subunit protein mL46 n=1 Tax=Mycena indigotica TaxID=2126181 RepID=A0A8H6VYQ2_9AGAR|nr:50S ribosomal subunit L30 [Mycena indigotica]KAF7295143.1 50S ribosomal subunit L30 [Mycena indigotica]